MSYTKNELLNYWDKNGFECLEDIKDLQGMTFVPFVGAGMSVPFGYRTWNEFLKKVTASLTEKKKRTEVYNTLRKGEYLEAAELLNNFTNNALMGDVNCTPFVRQYGILFRKWGVFVCQKDIGSTTERRR